MSRSRGRPPRAQARDLLKKAIQALPESRAPLPAPEPSLTERVRALFEGSVLPVREIAQIAGVTERTIYKYAAKHRWKPRRRWVDGKAGERCRGWNPGGDFAPVKGAGGRFIPRAEADKPHPVGLKASDPAGAARAAAACVRAGELAAAAVCNAGQARRGEACIDAVGKVGAALSQLRKRECELAAQDRGRLAGGDAVSHAMQVALLLALARWEAAIREAAIGEAAGFK